MLVVSAIKKRLKARGFAVSADALEGLEIWIDWLIQQAASRAKENGRKTVRKGDF